MKKMICILCMAAMAVVAVECAGDKEVITVASETADCTGVGPQKCLLVKRNGSTGWEFWYSGIEGFDYEKGYEYKLKIRREKIENPAADQSSLKYVLVKVISKTQKVSENMPPSVMDKNN